MAKKTVKMRKTTATEKKRFATARKTLRKQQRAIDDKFFFQAGRVYPETIEEKIRDGFLAQTLREATPDMKRRIEQILRAELEAMNKQVRVNLDELKKPIEIAVTLPTQWQTKNNQVLAIREMENEHLRNAISWCARRLAKNALETTWIADMKPLMLSLLALLHEAGRRGMCV